LAALAACSFQNFDYLKGEYKSSIGGASSSGGSAAGAGGGANGGASAAIGGASGSVNLGGSPDAGGTSAGGEIGLGEAGEGGAPPEPPGTLVNPGFELGSATTVPSWVNVGDTAAATVVYQQAHTGSGRLGHWLATGAYQVSTSQVVKPLPDGNYTFSIWVEHSLFLNAEYIFARGYSRAEPAAQMKLDTTEANDAAYTQIVLQHIPVTSGKCEVGIYTDGGADSSTNWSLIDDAELTLEVDTGS
jgi:hypothetical protein